MLRLIGFGQVRAISWLRFGWRRGEAPGSGPAGEGARGLTSDVAKRVALSCCDAVGWVLAVERAADGYRIGVRQICLAMTATAAAIHPGANASAQCVRASSTAPITITVTQNTTIANVRSTATALRLHRRRSTAHVTPPVTIPRIPAKKTLTASSTAAPVVPTIS